MLPCTADLVPQHLLNRGSCEPANAGLDNHSGLSGRQHSHRLVFLKTCSSQRRRILCFGSCPTVVAGGHVNDCLSVCHRHPIGNHRTYSQRRHPRCLVCLVFCSRRSGRTRSLYLCLLAETFGDHYYCRTYRTEI